jgi:hypothetical protein
MKYIVIRLSKNFLVEAQIKKISLHKSIAEIHSLKPNMVCRIRLLNENVRGSMIERVIPGEEN